jgi:hypothetical protein
MRILLAMVEYTDTSLRMRSATTEIQKDLAIFCDEVPMLRVGRRTGQRANIPLKSAVPVGRQNRVKNNLYCGPVLS